jgi:hypothetical protein
LGLAALQSGIGQSSGLLADTAIAVTPAPRDFIMSQWFAAPSRPFIMFNLIGFAAWTSHPATVQGAIPRHMRAYGWREAGPDVGAQPLGQMNIGRSATALTVC